MALFDNAAAYDPNKRNNPFLNSRTGLYDKFGDVVAATDWRARQKALTTPQTAAGSPLLTIRRGTKNPALEALFQTNLSRVGAADVAAGKAVDAFGNAIGAAGRDVEEEAGQIGRVFNGDLAGQLAANRARYKESVTGAGGASDAAYAATRAGYGATQGSLIDKLGLDLSKNRTDYGAQAGGEITAEEAALAGLRSKRARAARLATDLALKHGAAEAAGRASLSNLGGSSYDRRIAMGLNNEAEVGLQNQLADLESNDYAGIRDQRRSLTDRLAALDRGEIGDISGRRFGLSDSLTGMERDDLGRSIGRADRLNDTLFNAERGDVNYLTDTQARLAGLRRNLRVGAAGDILAPVTARQGIMRDSLGNLSALGQLDDQNSVYEIDDNGQFAPRQFISPYRGGGRSSTPNPEDYFAGRGGGGTSRGGGSGGGAPTLRRQEVSLGENTPSAIFRAAGVKQPDNWNDLSDQMKRQYLALLRQNAGTGGGYDEPAADNIDYGSEYFN